MQPLSQTENSEGEEDEAFHKDSSKGDLEGYLASAVEADDSVSEISVQAHAGRNAHGQVGKQTHAECRKGRNGSSSSNDISADLLLAKRVFLVVVADRVTLAAVADAGTASIGYDRGIDGDNIGHGEEGGHTGTDLGEEVRIGSSLGLKTR